MLADLEKCIQANHTICLSSANICAICGQILSCLFLCLFVAIPMRNISGVYSRLPM